MEAIQKGLCDLEDGLVNIVDGLKDILSENEAKRKHRSDVLGEIYDICECTEGIGSHKDYCDNELGGIRSDCRCKGDIW